MKAKLKTTFERYGQYITGHIEDPEMYENVKSGRNKWKDTMYSRITHIRLPKEVFERLLTLDREQKLLINDFKSNNPEVISNNADEKMVDMPAVQNCQNLEESYGEICVKCNKCGRFTEAEELFSILSNTMNGANFDDLNDAVYRILDKANYHKQIEGKWVEDTEYYDDDYSECNVRKVFVCSKCGRTERRKEPYCNCGAKMKGGA